MDKLKITVYDKRLTTKIFLVSLFFYVRLIGLEPTQRKLLDPKTLVGA